jgi:hypothetical protein
MASPKESEHSSMIQFILTLTDTLELQIDPSSMTTLNNVYATSDDIEMQTPRSETQLFYDEKRASVAASPPPSLPIVEPSVAPRYNDNRWRKTWDKMVARGRWPRIIYGTVFCTLLLCWVGVMSGVMSELLLSFDNHLILFVCRVGFMASENQYGTRFDLASDDAVLITRSRACHWKAFNPNTLTQTPTRKQR